MGTMYRRFREIALPLVSFQGDGVWDNWYRKSDLDVAQDKVLV